MDGVEDLPPVVWKSDFHFTPEALDLLTGVVDVFVADFKFGNDACAHRLSGINHYLSIVTRNLLAARSRGRLIVRHLLLPGHDECCWKPIAAWLAEHLPDVEVSIRGGFMPRWRSTHFAELGRPLDTGGATTRGTHRSKDAIEGDPMKKAYEDDSDLTEITIQPDGRLYAFGVSEKILEVLRLLEDGVASAPTVPTMSCGSEGQTALLHVEN